MIHQHPQDTFKLHHLVKYPISVDSKSRYIFLLDQNPECIAAELNGISLEFVVNDDSHVQQADTPQQLG